MKYLVVLLLAGCAVNVPDGAGNKFTIEHMTNQFGSAQAAAAKHCTARGLDTVHLGTYRSQPSYNLSTFECVEKK